MLFPRDFKETPDGGLRTSGDHIKVRDYFEHAMAHPALDPYFYLTPRSRTEECDVWKGVPENRIVRELDPAAYDLFFLTGKEWKLLPRDLSGDRLVQYVQSIRQCVPEHKLFKYLKRSAHRICTSDEVAAATAPHIQSDPVVIPNGIPLDLFKPGKPSERSVLIWGRKHRDAAEGMRRALEKRGFVVDLIVDYVPRKDFAGRLAASEFAITLPARTEGFFLPALEAMASGAAVVCADARGNRAFCIEGETCLMPPRGNIAAHVAAVERYAEDRAFAERVRMQGIDIARRFSLARERAAFHRFINERVLEPAVV